MKLAITTIIWVLIVNSNAHVDRELKIREDGMIVGLPKKYQPTRFDLKRGELTVRESQLRLSDSIMALFPDEEDDPFARGAGRIVPDVRRTTLRVLVGGVHEGFDDSHSMAIEWRTNGSEHWFSIHVDLERLEVVDVRVHLREGDGAKRYLSLSMPKIESEE